MTDVATGTRRGESFASAAPRWDAAKFGSWLRTGLDIWVHPLASRGQRAIAFRPLILDPDRDPLPGLVDAAQMIPGGLERLRDAKQIPCGAAFQFEFDLLDAAFALGRDDPAVIDGKFQFAAFGADRHGDAMYRGLEDRFQFAPQLL